MSTETTETKVAGVSFGKAMKAGLIAGLIGAGLNNLWSIIAQALGAEAPAGFPVAVTISSILPVMIGALIYFLLVKYLPKGELIFIIVGTLFTLLSFVPTFTTTEIQPGVPVGEGFTLLTLPMHVISGVLALWLIPRLSK